MNLDNIIKHLRLKPSVGMPGADDWLASIAKFMEDIGMSAGATTPNVIAFGESLRMLTADANLLQVGLEKLSKLQSDHNANYLTSIKSATYLLEREKQLAKVFGITAKASALLSNKYSTMSQELGISDELVNKYRISLNKMIPGMSANLAKTGGYGKTLIQTNDVLQRHIGLTGEQTNALTLAAAATGTDLESSVINTRNFAKAYENATGEVGVFSDLMKAVADTSLDLRVEYSKFPQSLEVATLKARQLGLSMSDIDKASTGLLDIESSIGKELEYQLISGKRLVDASGNSLTNKLREAKLSGDAVGQANAMTEILTTQSNILEHGNYLQKQALADATGLTVEQLQGANAQMKLQKQIYAQMEAQNNLKIGGKEIKSSVDLTMDDMKKAIAQMPDEQKKLSLEAITKAESQLTAAESMEDKLQRIINDGIKIQTSKGNLADILDASVTNIPESLEQFKKSTEYTQQDPIGYGKNALISEAVTNLVDRLTTYLDSKIGSTTVTTEAAAAAKTAIEKLYGKTFVAPHGGTTNESTEVPTKQDAFMMHDGVINFDKRDKFTMIASPYGAMHESVTDKLTGGAGGGSRLDANAIGKAIQSAILTGLNSVSWTVNLDPMAVDKAIKFNSGRLNS